MVFEQAGTCYTGDLSAVECTNAHVVMMGMPSLCRLAFRSTIARSSQCKSLALKVMNQVAEGACATPVRGR